jgi:hypothetical protein
MKQQIVEHTTQLPSLRIAYKNQVIRRRKKNGNLAAKNVEIPSEVIPVVSEPVVAKEPLPMFDDYKFKARDYDPL